MAPGGWVEDDWEGYERRDRYGGYRPPPRRDFLDTGDHRLDGGVRYTSGIHRSRSVGHGPTPDIRIYNNIEQDPYIRNDDHNHTEAPRQNSPRRGRAADREWELRDKLTEAQIENARLRSASRNRQDAAFTPPVINVPGYPYPVAPPAPPVWNAPFYGNAPSKPADDPNAEQRLRIEYEKKELEARRRRFEEDQKHEAEERAREEAKEAMERRFKYEYEERERKRELREREEEAEKKRIIDAANMKKARDDAEAKANRERAVADWERKRKEEEEEMAREIAEWERKKRAAEEKAKLEHERAVAEYEKKKADAAKKAKEDEERIIAKMKADKADQEAKEKAAFEAYQAKMERKKQEEKEEEEEFERRRAERMAKKKKEEEEAQQKIDDELAKRLAVAGFQHNQIQAMINPKEHPNPPPGWTPGRPLEINQAPTYVKMHRSHIDIETLRYFDLPWEWDASDKDYIIITQELSHRDTDQLFEHTRRLRTRASKLLIEERGTRNDEPQYAWVKHRRRSTSRRRNEPQKLKLRLF